MIFVDTDCTVTTDQFSTCLTVDLQLLLACFEQRGTALFGGMRLVACAWIKGDNLVIF